MRANTQKYFLRTLIAWSVMAAGPKAANAQDLLQYFDLTSDEFTKADMTRAEVEAALAKLPDGETLDLSAKRLNKLDLSGMDFSRTKLNAARVSGCNFKGPIFQASASIAPGR